ncbi:MAG: hypothetical protein JRI25_22600 [Deltaproteobacteria bacterium]|nr:hypothetical protein [Deltaproteobacteria bacterium]
MQIGATLGNEVVLVGVSTGVTLAAVHALQHPENAIAGLVAISPNFGPATHAAELLRVPWVGWALPRILGERSWEPENETQARYWTHRYPHTALLPMMALVAHARTQDWSAMTVPVLVTVVPWDQGISEDAHVLAGDTLLPEGNAFVEAAILEAVDGAPRP